MSEDPHAARCRALARRLRICDEVAVAFSGGVDSGVLLHAAHAVLGPRAVGITADSPSLPRQELREAREFAAGIGVRLAVLPAAELDDPRYRANAGDRCYFCKQALFDAMEAWGRDHGFATLAFGEIVDDAADDRPGARAAAERGVIAPLRDAGFTKDDVRRYARRHGLAVADKPASACLASRIPLGSEVTAERLAQVETAERAVRGLGFRVLRVRHLGRRARLEVGAGERPRAESLRTELARAVGEGGFEDLELATYRSPGTIPRREGGV